MYAGRIQYVGVRVLPLLLTMLDDKTYFCDTIPPFTLESLPSTVNHVLVRRSYGHKCLLAVGDTVNSDRLQVDTEL